MNKKYLIIIVVLAIVAVYGGGLLYPYCVKPSAGGFMLAMSDENLSEVEVILRENLPTSFTVRVSSSSPRYYTVIPSSEFNSLKETLRDNESMEITSAKQENGATYAFFGLCFGKLDSDFDITELQEPLNKYSLEAKEVNRIYVQFEDNVRLSEIEEILHLLENESNVIEVSPDVLER